MIQEPGNHNNDVDRSLIRNGVIDLGTLFRIAKLEAITIAATVVALLLLAIVYLHFADQKYAVRMVITASASHSQTPGGGTLDEFSSLAGIDLPTAGNPQFKLFVSALRSPFAAQAIAAHEDLLRSMFPKEWSASDQ